MSQAELPSGYVGGLRKVSASLSLFKGLLFQPSAAQIRSLDAAMAATESSAWRGAKA